MTRTNLQNLRSRPDSTGCRDCGNVATGALRALPTAEAIRVMQAAGFEPVAPYRGSGKRWPSLCTETGVAVEPSLDNVRANGHSCRACQVPGGDWNGPTLVYLLHHAELGALKVGIAKLNTKPHSERRVERLSRRFGWTAIKTLLVPTGRRAYEVEQAVIKWWRTDLGYPPYLGPEDTEGWTETVSDEVGLLATWAFVERYGEGGA